jgi:hypothetical protein
MWAMTATITNPIKLLMKTEWNSLASASERPDREPSV